jgi:hypothetical protein
MKLLATFASAALVAAAGCASDAPEDAPTLAVEYDTLGDTLLVRTLSGSVWGGTSRLVPELSIGELDGDVEYLFGRVVSLAVSGDGTIYVVDRQVPDLRAFAPDGSFIATIGTPGEGPGELKGPDGGLAVLSDGRILVRDPGNARIQVYAPTGEPLDTWPIRGGFNTSNPMFRDNEDHVHTQILLDPEAEVADWVTGLVRISPDGTPVDTLVPPDVGYEALEVEARNDEGENHSVSRNGVPFAPSETWTLHPDGYFIHGVSTEYRVDLLKSEHPVRIERVYRPIPVSGAERSEEEARVVRNMRYTDPNWRWNGPSIPDHKPAFQRLYAGKGGRIWVHVSLPSYERDDPDYDPKDPEAVENRWREPVGFDVFETDGSYLGRVEAPESFSLYPTPVIDGDYVWATTRDDLGVQRVVRFRIERGDAS